MLIVIFVLSSFLWFMSQFMYFNLVWFVLLDAFFMYFTLSFHFHCPFHLTIFSSSFSTNLELFGDALLFYEPLVIENIQYSQMYSTLFDCKFPDKI